MTTDQGVYRLADVTVPEPTTSSKKRIKPRRRQGNVSKIEQKLLEDVLRQQTTELTPMQERSLGHVFQRGPGVMKKMIQEARDRFAERAGEYTDIHFDSAKGALADGDYETAGSLAWQAMKEIASEGVRVIDKANEAVQVPKVMIGIKLGGFHEPEQAVVAVEGVVVPHE